MVRRIFALAIAGCTLLAAFLLGSEPTSTVSKRPAKSVNSVEQLHDLVRRLQSLQQPLGKPKPGEWLAQHKEEGQTFAQFLKRHPLPTPPDLSTLYIQPI